MIWNIIDRRTRPYRWAQVNAIIEAVEHDNSCADADQAPEAAPDMVIDYDQREAISVEQAVKWASQQDCAVTLYLYDIGTGTTGSGHFVTVGQQRF
jgi:hypothetical protein